MKMQDTVDFSIQLEYKEFMNEQELEVQLRMCMYIFITCCILRIRTLKQLKLKMIWRL